MLIKAFQAFQDWLNPAPQPLSALAKGLCAVPVPVQKAKPVKKPDPVDAYIERAETNTWGFHSATAVLQQEGSVAHLTSYDEALLKERGYYGKTKAVVNSNALAKKAWHEGKTEREAATITGKGASWIEKRFGTFSSALSMEKGVDL
jgi:hypothetical protein